MTEEQVERLRSYLDADAQAHIRTNGRWRLDGGKLVTALEHAGVQVGNSGRFVVTLWIDSMDGPQMRTWAIAADSTHQAAEMAADLFGRPNMLDEDVFSMSVHDLRTGSTVYL